MTDDNTTSGDAATVLDAVIVGQAAQAVGGRAKLRQRVGLKIVEAYFEAVQVHGSIPVQLLMAMTMTWKTQTPCQKISY